jgi:hypothetical protein
MAGARSSEASSLIDVNEAGLGSEHGDDGDADDQQLPIDMDMDDDIDDGGGSDEEDAEMVGPFEADEAADSEDESVVEVGSDDWQGDDVDPALVDVQLQAGHPCIPGHESCEVRAGAKPAHTEAGASSGSCACMPAASLQKHACWHPLQGFLGFCVFFLAGSPLYSLAEPRAYVAPAVYSLCLT